MLDKNELLNQAKELLKNEMTNISFTTWIKTLEIGNIYDNKIELITSNNKLDPYGGEGTFNVKMNWDYESGNDALDTKWGTDAYNYKQNHPDEPGLKIIIELKITQSLS